MPKETSMRRRATAVYGHEHDDQIMSVDHMRQRACSQNIPSMHRADDGRTVASDMTLLY
jgi:hypothetical protein